MVNDSATLSPAVAAPHPAMVDRVACLRGLIERSAYEPNLPTLAAAMLGFGDRQIADRKTPSKI